MTTPAGQPPAPGVVVVPTIAIADSIQRHVAAVLGQLPADAKGAFVAIPTLKGINLAVAYKADNGWQVAGWIGKSGWDQPILAGLDGGLVVQKFWR